MTQGIKISIIIVNYNSGKYLRNCINSIEDQTYDNYEIIIVDNASVDESIPNFSKTPKITILQNKKNLGFAKAQNQGMQLAKGEYLMPLNFDIYLRNDFLFNTIQVMDKFPKVGTVSPKMLLMTEDGVLENRFDNAGLIFTKRRMVCHRGQKELDYGQFQNKEYIFGAKGASAVYRREMLEDIAYKDQFFDESYFMWYEDIDLDWRGRLRGWECLYFPEAVCYHVGDPHGHGRSKFGAETSIRNRWKMILSNECPHCFLRYAPYMLYEELNLLRYVFQKHLIGSYLRALASFLRSFPATLEKRRFVRGNAIRSCLPNYPMRITGE